MKKNLIALVIVSVGSLTGISRAEAQTVSNSSSLEYQMNATKTKTSMNEFEAISPRALKNFADTYKNISGESWTKVKGGFSALFTLNDIRTTILYDSRGYWVGSIKHYYEEKMLHEVRHIVKSTYYDYSIIYIQEVETADTKGMPTYIICLEDKAKIKMIRICDGEMSVWKEYTKSN
ncbi:MAG TPA: hypothetical protein VIU35_12285 [Chitinophagaceae bacterium]